ncbi:hypothetical protein NGTWS0302_12980 [Mycolicibacterium cyprinidarum]|uniref:Mce protein n=1 Tax=Mycolicibacterium cyprinidarum TaxID=2860311 RepID=A0ABQ4VAU5_9MYCO|nr:hypothetical protein NGTWS1702_20190 [Mycolicibacterium sp. NGTWSNA01]GJF16961.1 hypothetical protein NGTWS0302_12980 [Mycolicibacterium sp. NGTWS0302]
MSKDAVSKDEAEKATAIQEDDPAVAAETKVDEAPEADKVADADTDAEDVANVSDTDTDTDDDSAADEADSEADDSAVDDSAEDASATPKRRIQWSRVVAFALLPALALVLALGAGYLKWRDDSVRNSETAAVTSVQAAKDATIALLSYQPDTVEQQLGAARDLLTGEFRESYTALTNDVVIPGAKEKQISAVASVPAAASVSATPTEAVALIFVNQTVSVAQDPPTDTASSVRVTLEKVGDRWLISKFDPV